MVARNFSMLMTAQLFSWVLAVASMIVIPRYLGAASIGRLHLSSSMWMIGLVFAGFGMDLLLTKEIARLPGRTGEMVATSVAVRLVLLVPAALLLFAYAAVADYADETIGIMVVLGVSSLLTSITGAMAAALRGLEDMKAISLATIVERVFIVGGGVGLVVAGYGVNMVASAVVAGAASSLVIHLRALARHRRVYDDNSRFRTDFAAMRQMVAASAPYFGVKFFAVLYRQLDVVIIAAVIESDEVLGWYSIYDRFAGTLLFVPTVLVTAVYPTLSRLHTDDSEKSVDLIKLGFRVMLLISVPLGLSMSAIAEPLIVFLVGEEFANAGPVLAVGGIVLSLTYLNIMFGTFLVAMDRQAAWNLVMVIGAVMTVPLDLVLVPFFDRQADNGAIGGAAAYLVTETFILASAIWLLPRGSLPDNAVAYVVKVVAAGLVMVGVMVPLNDAPLAVPLVAGAATYIAAAFVFRAVDPDDRRLVMAARTSRGRHAEGHKSA